VILFSTVFFFVGLLVAVRWRMNTKLGYGLFALYAMYVRFVPSWSGRIVVAS
jgi:hypothetical protein